MDIEAQIASLYYLKNTIGESIMSNNKKIEEMAARAVEESIEKVNRLESNISRNLRGMERLLYIKKMIIQRKA